MPKARILFLSANPCDTSGQEGGATRPQTAHLPRLALDREVREIEAKIRAAEHRDQLELVTRWAVRPDDLLQSLNEHRPHIVHFSGHGSEEAAIYLLDGQDNLKPVS